MSDGARQQPIPTVEPGYPTLIAVARYGRVIGWIAAVVAFLLIAGSGYNSPDVIVTLLALAGALVTKLLAQLITDIARLLVDTLVPR